MVMPATPTAAKAATEETPVPAGPGVQEVAPAAPALPTVLVVVRARRSAAAATAVTAAPDTAPRPLTRPPAKAATEVTRVLLVMEETAVREVLAEPDQQAPTQQRQVVPAVPALQGVLVVLAVTAA
jgi:hypothetical protein